MTKYVKKNLIATLIVTFLATVSIVAAGAYNAKMMEENTAQVKEKSQSVYPVVSVISVTPHDYTSQITGYGEAKARYELSLKAEVSGKITSLAMRFETGRLIEKGRSLVIVDDSNYLKQLMSAKSSLSTARLNLLEEQRQSQQARLEWESSGISGRPSSPLVLREPQLQVAKAELEHAKQEMKVAQHDLAKTNISAPFNALIVSREVQLGSYLQMGEAVATLYSTDKIEVSIPLSNRKWANFDQQQLKRGDTIPVILTSHDGQHAWTGYVDRVEQHLEQTTRQRSVVVVVEKPIQQEQPLFPNAYVKVSIQGKKLNNLLRLPQTAISQNSEVWHVDNNNTLKKVAVNKIYEDQKFAYIHPFSTPDHQALKVVVRPLSSYTEGAKMLPNMATSSSMAATASQKEIHTKNEEVASTLNIDGEA